MMKLIIKGNRSEAALALQAHDIAILEDLKEIPSCLVSTAIWSEAKIHPCYGPKVRCWFKESHKVPFLPGDLLFFYETELSELI
jgi:hypothetical protein